MFLLLGACADPEPAVAPQDPSPTPTETEAETEPDASPEPVPTALPNLDTPEAVASELIAAEQAIRSPDTDPRLLPRLGRIQQAAYRAAVREPAFKQAVLDAAPPGLRSAVEANISAGESLTVLTGPGAQLPDWEIVEPAPADELRAYYAEAEAEFGIPWGYLASIHLIETRMGRIRGTSSAGAQGPMQFMPPTWAAYGQGDVHDNRDAIMGAARYLRASGAPSDMPRALFAYNRSQRYVEAITRYAEQMLENELAFRGYYHWQVYFRMAEGDVLLEVGYRGPE